MYGLFGGYDIVTLLSTLHLTVKGIIIPSLQLKLKNCYVQNGCTDILVMIIELLRFLKGAFIL